MRGSPALPITGRGNEVNQLGCESTSPVLVEVTCVVEVFITVAIRISKITITHTTRPKLCFQFLPSSSGSPIKPRGGKQQHLCLLSLASLNNLIQKGEVKIGSVANNCRSRFVRIQIPIDQIATKLAKRGALESEQAVRQLVDAPVGILPSIANH